MNKQLKLFTSSFFIALLLLLSIKTAKATEGTAELVSTSDTQTKCFASSVMMQDFRFKVITSCKNLVFPAAENKFAYMLWATPTSGGKTIKLGSLNLGKAEFTVKEPFSALFVTTEANTGAKAPSANSTVARGTIQSIQHLEKQQEPEPEAVTARTTPAENFGEILEEPSPAATETVEEEEPDQGLLGSLGTGAIVGIIGIFLVLIILAIITRSRS